jgi:hypothetical protein
MTFINRLSRILLGFGAPKIQDSMFLQANKALSGTGQQTFVLPAALPSSWNAPNTMSAGWAQIKIYAGTGTSPTLVDLVLQGSDGVNTVTFGVIHPNSAIALSSTGSCEFLIPFQTDLTLSSITLSTTLGGTSPGATLDWEVLGTVGSSPVQS